MTHLEKIQQLADQMSQEELIEALKYLVSLLEIGPDYSWETPEFFAELDRRREAVQFRTSKLIPSEIAFQELYSQLNLPS